MDDALFIHRLHFAFTITYHYLSPQGTMGLAALIVVRLTSLSCWRERRWRSIRRCCPPPTGDANTITPFNAAAGPRSLVVDLYWWIPGMLIAIAYFVLVYRMFAGKVTAEDYFGH